MSQITLTFDNGPTEAVTPWVLDVLAKYDIRSTFFVLGKNIVEPSNRALMHRAREEGHWIGNHTFTHEVPLGKSTVESACDDEIGRTQSLIGDAAHPDKLFRPFGGGGVVGPHLLSPAACTYLETGGYTCVLWNSISRDWEDPDGWVDTALQQCAHLENALTVLHDYETGAMRNLERFIVRALERGDSFQQAFPPACVPMHRGVRILPMDSFICTPVRAIEGDHQ
ncbi:polysaccharide deacetylase family protein [Cupriavidus sp. SW-Y-13]|uniref:polysaccharide deacetylase family protein n=1 Tax=Cupriavidus sp. SW-Y-13 TaxID=2653854 RepID=UPI0013656A52|nr:polysaccharide deacetylase family protein [Cupriavidus sp. SW-Y-13]MWL91352.1 polysaccharide deacetylase family protein [Cupriavidus sp. SW-Y-13]